MERSNNTYLDEYFNNPQLLNMTMEDEEEKDYIVNLENQDGNIVITYADGHKVTDGAYSIHNMNCWRRRIINQVEKYYDKYQEQGGKELFDLLKNEIKAISVPVIGGIIIHLVSKLFLQYNIDIHIAIKIVLEALLVLYAAKETFLNYLDTRLILRLLTESNRFKKYTDAKDDLEYYDKDIEDYNYALPIEEVWNSNLQPDQIEDCRKAITKAKKEYGERLRGFTLTHKKRERANI